MLLLLSALLQDLLLRLQLGADSATAGRLLRRPGSLLMVGALGVKTWPAATATTTVTLTWKTVETERGIK